MTIQVDGHIHIERGPYTKDWVDSFVDQALKMNLTTIYLLEHSHRFFEFKDLYNDVTTDNSSLGSYQKKWLNKHMQLSIEDYKQFITEMKQQEWPLEIKWGLEVCYFPHKENVIREILDSYDWDFTTGSVHWVNGWGFDHPNNKYSWEEKGVNETYKRYYEMILDLVNSELFTNLGHPDSIKCFNHYPNFDLTKYYQKIAQAAKKNGVIVEFNCGLKNNYNHSELGINKRFLEVLKKENVPLITASDAHKPEDVGKRIAEGNELIKNMR